MRFITVELHLFRNANLFEGSENRFLIFGRENCFTTSSLEVAISAKLANQLVHECLILMGGYIFFWKLVNPRA